ncbi:SRPBCC family protein [Streptomyces sp. NBC_00984]|uniref:SRPBCC family protein n=1 Tax=Streptomyces sp. NBC_00984 TaxID=2903700 RepID=UPI00386347F2|nr:SRPBCC family protein [Streptomyces sp. NBC_00984]
MPHVSANVHVSRPADEIFSFLRDPRNLAEWSSSIDRVIEGPIATELGDEYTCKFPGRRRAHRLRCTASTPVEYLAFRGAGMWTPLGRHSPELEFRLSPSRQGTTVTVSVKPHLDGGMIILAPFVTMAWRRDLPSELRCLADLLGDGATAESGAGEPGDGRDPGTAGDGRDAGDGQGTAPSVGWPG